MSRTKERDTVMHGRSRNGREALRHSEGTFAKTIEDQTARLPSDTFLWAAGCSILGSLFLGMKGDKHAGLFVGQWTPVLLIMGLYNKVVKVSGSDRTSE